MLIDFLNNRRNKQRQERQTAAEISAARQAGSMTRGERDALRRRPILVVGPGRDQGPFSLHGIPTHTNPAKHATRADRIARQAARRQSRGR